MIQTNLILVDGLPGSGKSVTAQILSLHLNRLGLDAEWFFEHQSSHPIYRYDDPERMFDLSVTESKEVAAQALVNWQKLADRLQGTSRVVILESTLFQMTIGWLQLMDTDREEIIRFVCSISQILTEVNPALIYFYQDDVPTALRKTCELRGDWFPTFLISRIGRTPYGKRESVADLNGVITFYERVRSITDELFSKLSFAKTAIETSARDWRRYYRQISDLLQIPPIDPVFPAPDGCGRLVGRYRELNSGNEIGIGCDSEGLYFEEPGRPRLFHNKGNSFCVEGVCIQFSFQDRVDGGGVEIEASGDVPGAGGRWIRV